MAFPDKAPRLGIQALTHRLPARTMIANMPKDSSPTLVSFPLPQPIMRHNMPTSRPRHTPTTLAQPHHHSLALLLKASLTLALATTVRHRMATATHLSKMGSLLSTTVNKPTTHTANTSNQAAMTQS